LKFVKDLVELADKWKYIIFDDTIRNKYFFVTPDCVFETNKSHRRTIEEEKVPIEIPVL